VAEEPSVADDVVADAKQDDVVADTQKKD